MFDPNVLEMEVADGDEIDAIYVLKDGNPVRLEVPDDVEDNSAQ